MCKLYAFNIQIDLLSSFRWKFNLLLQIGDLVIFVYVQLVFNCLVYTSLNVYTYSLSLFVPLIELRNSNSDRNSVRYVKHVFHICLQLLLETFLLQ